MADEHSDHDALISQFVGMSNIPSNEVCLIRQPEVNENLLADII